MMDKSTYKVVVDYYMMRETGIPKSRVEQNFIASRLFWTLLPITWNLRLINSLGKFGGWCDG